MSPIRRRGWTPPGSRGWATALGATLVIGALAAGLALAVHDEGFQLDGNTRASDLTTGYPSPGDVLTGDFAGQWDWDSLFNASGEKRAPLPDGFLDASFRKDFWTKTRGGSTIFDSSDPTTFTTGSKDILNVNQWRCVGANNVTDKGDIINAYSAVYRNDEGERILYFGLEKYIDNGSNNVGFWFLGDGSVGCAEGGTGNGNPFTGVHLDGDLLIVSEFTNGGGVSTIKAYRWNRPDPALPGSLSAEPVEVGVDCVRGTGSENLDMCATTNVLSHSPIWPHASKTLGLDAGYPPATFFEGGINLTNTEFADACFNGFLANTRSSQETTATLYDFTSGTLGACGSLTVTKVTGPDTTDPTNFSYTTTEPSGKTNIPDTFMLDTDPADPSAGSDALPASRTWSAVPPGAYTIDEDSVAGWYTGSLVCTRNGEPFDEVDDTTDASTGVASFTMGFGDNIACTYSNYKPSAFLDITGDAVNRVGDDHEFTVTARKNNGQGGGNVLAGGVDVTVQLTDANGASSGGNQTCTTEADDTDPDYGTCSVTFSSATTGTTTGTASATITVHGVPIPVTTSANATTAANEAVLKQWVDAAIDISGDGVNRVGDTHSFTVTTYAEGSGSGATMDKVGGVLATVKFTSANGADSIADKTCTTSSVAGAGFGTCTVSFSSDATGTNTAHATATITVEGEAIAVDSVTDAKTAGAEEVTKAWVDSAIDITGDGTNRVGIDHEFTVTTYAEGSGSGADMDKTGGVDVTVQLTDANGAASGGNQACTTEADDTDPDYGTCSVTFSSATTGTTTGTASATITVETEPIAVSTTTDSTTAGAADALKKWVDAALDISGDGTNRVGVDHDFTVTAWADDSGSGGFEKDGGVEVTVAFAADNGAGAIANKTCTTSDGAGDPAFGTCVVTFSSLLTGTHTGTASATITVETEPIAVSTSTDSTTAGAADAVKTWVDARLSIAGNGTNGIGEPHTFTAHLERDRGDGFGFVDASGEQVEMTLVDGGGAAYVLDETQTTCDVDAFDGAGTDADGECDVVFTSDTAGTVTGSASATIVVGGVTINLASGDSTASEADDSVLKTFVAGSLRWLKVDHHGDPLGGATFEVCRTHDLDSSTSTMVELTEPVCVTVLDDATPDTDSDPGELELTGLVLGRYTVEETIPPTGYSIPDDPGAGPFTFDDMSLADPDVVLGTTFVNVKLYRIIVLTCDDGTDTLVESIATLGGDPLTDKLTINPDAFAALGWQNAAGDPLTEQDLCNMGFASFGDLDEGTYSVDVELPDLLPYGPR